MVAGSDCPTGKEQLNKAGARERIALWRSRGNMSMNFYRCALCECYHVGHRSSKKKKQERTKR